tara:strand:+ start:59 stop:493 length:435 start_codon:yes stop_codon:yes gene_type:complete
MNNDRKTLIRLASSLPKGSDERRTLLAELQKQSALKGTGVRVLEGYRSDGESDFDGQYHNYRDWDEAIKKTNWGFEERPEGEWDEQWTGEWSVQLIADRPSDAEPDWHGNEVIPQDALIFESKVEPSKDQLQAIKRKWKPVRFD